MNELSPFMLLASQTHISHLKVVARAQSCLSIRLYTAYIHRHLTSM